MIAKIDNIVIKVKQNREKPYANLPELLFVTYLSVEHPTYRSDGFESKILEQLKSLSLDNQLPNTVKQYAKQQLDSLSS